MNDFISYLSGGQLSSEIDVNKLPFVFFEEYHRFLSLNGYQAYIFVSENGALVPFCRKKSKIISTIYLLYPPIKNGARLEKEDHVYDEFISKLNSQFKFDNILPYVPIAVSTSAPKGSKSAPFGNVFVNLKDFSEEELFKSFQSSNRNIIRKALKEGAYVKIGEEVFDDFYTIHSNTLIRQGLYCNSKSEIELMYTQLKNRCLCAVVYNKSNVPEGSILVPFSEYGGYSYFAGSAQKPEIRGAVKLLHWEVIKALKKLNVNKFVLGGVRLSDDLDSKFIGMRDFKMSFGSTLDKGVLWKVEPSTMKIKLYKMAVKTKLKLKGESYLSDVIDQIN